jgi:hypothetical protein
MLALDEPGGKLSKGAGKAGVCDWAATLDLISVTRLRFAAGVGPSARDRAMRLQLKAALLVGVPAILMLSACGESERAGEGTPSYLRTRFTAEMKAILRDVKMAEETAAAIAGGYVNLEELRRSYFNRVVPDSYELTLSDVSASGYRAEVVHKATGLRCRVVVGSQAGGTGEGVPTCE